MLAEEIQSLTLAMEVAKAEHQHSASNVANFNNITSSTLTKVDFNAVLTQHFTYPATELQSLIQKHSTELEKSSFSLDQLTADAIDASGKYRALVETLNRKLGLMNIAITSRER